MCRSAALAGLALAFGVQPGFGQRLMPPERTTEGVFALATEDTVTVYDLAAAFAPILWFSDHEPLLLGAPGGQPARIPPDRVTSLGDTGIVYYRATVVSPRRGVPLWSKWGLATNPTPVTAYFTECDPLVPEEDPTPDCLDLREIHLIRLQYLFYFPYDVGGGGHPHDLEIAEFWFEVEDSGTDHRLWLDRIIGYAHGHRAFANKLEPKKDNPPDYLSLPVVLLIERGKHAPAPDRTFDGDFTPGFDVNRMVGDAWGIRDVFGSQWLGSRTYSSWMTLPRDSALQAYLPREVIPSGYVQAATGSWPYELRDFEPSIVEDDVTDELRVYLEYHGYRDPPQDGPTQFMRLQDHFGLGGRLDLGLGPYLSVMGPALPLIGGHLVATGTVGVTYAGNGVWGGWSALYSPSVIGFFNVYGGVTHLMCWTCASGAGIGPEAGVKLRIPVPKPPAPDFVGIRLGLRYPSFGDLSSPRLLVELGLASP